MSVFEFCILALACYRLTVLFARDIGPMEVFRRLRAARGIGSALSCPHCVSIWIGFALCTVYHFTISPSPLLIELCNALALSAVAIILDRVFTYS